jgi:cell division protein DivIC
LVEFFSFLLGETVVAKLKDQEEKTGLPHLWLFVLLVFGALILGDLNQRMADARRLEREADLLEVELLELEEDTDRLNKEIEITNTEEFVERWAHNEAGMVRQGEVLVILVSPETEEPISGPPPEPDAPILGNMDVWLKLLIGQ